MTLFLLACFAGDLTLAQPEIAIDGSTQLSWNLADARDVYISTLGQVSAKGEKTVSPSMTMEYILMYTGPDGLVTDKVKLTVVTGHRGVFAPVEDFRHPVELVMGQGEINQMTVTVFDLLHESLGLVTDERHSPRKNRYLFLTKPVDKRELIKEPKSSRTYKVAVSAELLPLDGGEWNCVIKSYVRFKRLREKDELKYWHPGDDAAHDHTAQLIKQRLKKLME